jgi:hypothetical protein
MRSGRSSDSSLEEVKRAAELVGLFTALLNAGKVKEIDKKNRASVIAGIQEYLLWVDRFSIEYLLV